MARVPDNPPIRPFDDSCADYLRDESRAVGTADFISFPHTACEVRDVLRQTGATGAAVTLQGGRTGIVSGAVPRGGHVLNLSRMNRVTGCRRLSDGRFTLAVEPGVVLAGLNRMLEQADFDTAGWNDGALRALAQMKQTGRFFFAPDPTETSATIGGMVACNASGARTFGCGPTRSHVHGLTVALADGSQLRLVRGDHRAEGRRFRLITDAGRVIEGALPSYRMPAVKNAAGYHASDDMDLVDLFIGSEGTLGVVTGVDIVLTPRPAAVWGVTMFMPSEESAVRCVGVIRGLPVRPVAMEYFDAGALDLLRRQKAVNPAFAQLPDLPAGFICALYCEYHGGGEDAVSEAVEAAAEAAASQGWDGEASWLASDGRELARMKAFRHAVPEAVNLTIDERRRSDQSITKLGTDMAVPDAALSRVMALYRGGLAASGLEAVVFGHIGNNHVHVNILPRSAGQYDDGKRLYRAWAVEVVAMGGTVAAEHGIGKLKREFLELMYGREAVGEMRGLKRLFDPDMRLNPGNLFEPA